MRIPESILKLLRVSDKKPEIKICSGGSINAAYRIKTEDDILFLKINELAKHPDLFECEAEGLNLISRFVPAPKVLKVGKESNIQFLVLEWLEEIHMSESADGEAGKILAQLHQQSNNAYGFEKSNYIGNILQDNRYEENYFDFFVTRRIEPLLKKAMEKFGKDIFSIKKTESFFRHLPQLIPVEKPALIHGDLWSGNMMHTQDGVKFFDPSVHYGHRESDIGMSKLFGGFSDLFYEAYQEEFPLQKGWEKRCDYFNLYPLLAHLILFGRSYHESIKKILQPF